MIWRNERNNCSYVFSIKFRFEKKCEAREFRKNWKSTRYHREHDYFYALQSFTNIVPFCTDMKCDKCTYRLGVVVRKNSKVVVNTKRGSLTKEICDEFKQSNEWIVFSRSSLTGMKTIRNEHPYMYILIYTIPM